MLLNSATSLRLLMFFEATQLTLSYIFFARASTDVCFFSDLFTLCHVVTSLKVHPSLHEAGCVVKNAETLPKPRSVSWAPDKCSTCSSWLDRLRRSCFSVDDRSCLCSLLRAIVDRRRKSRLPEKSLWNFPPLHSFGITVNVSLRN